MKTSALTVKVSAEKIPILANGRSRCRSPDPFWLFSIEITALRCFFGWILFLSAIFQLK